MKSEYLIENLIELTQKSIDEVSLFLDFPLIELNKKESSESWSALECIEHLNLYSQFYIPEISKRIIDKKSLKESEIFIPGLLGGVFCRCNEGK